MALHTQTIGATMTAGFAGSYARQPDMIVITAPLGGTTPVAFGSPLKRDKTGNVVLLGAESTAENFVGVAARELKSSLHYLDQSVGQYATTEPVSVFQRGSIQVKCQRGTHAIGGKVYVRITENASYSTAVVGGFEEEADSANTIELTNCQWGGAADSNGVTELVILSRINA